MTGEIAGRRIVFVTYYGPPYVSGLTRHVHGIAAAAAAAGAEVQLIVGRHDRGLPERETIDGVRVRRLAVAARIDRAIVLPTLVPVALRAAARSDALILVTPMAEAGLIAALARRHTAVAVQHVCDAAVPGGLVARALVTVADLSARSAARHARQVFSLSIDYARHSRVLSELAGRVVAIPPPMNVAAFTRDGASPAERNHSPLRVGFLGRLTHEKGLDRLVEAVAALGRPARLTLAGPSAGVAGGGEGERLRAQAARLGVALELPGSLPDARVAGFLRGLDVFVLPSISSLEAWGIVQVEAMLCGTPVVASALAGVREPVTRTGMGLLVRPGDVSDLARAIARVADDRATFVRSREAVIRALELDEIPRRHVRALAALTRDAPRRVDRPDRWG